MLVRLVLAVRGLLVSPESLLVAMLEMVAMLVPAATVLLVVLLVTGSLMVRLVQIVLVALVVLVAPVVLVLLVLLAQAELPMVVPEVLVATVAMVL